MSIRPVIILYYNLFGLQRSLLIKILRAFLVFPNEAIPMAPCENSRSTYTATLQLISVSELTKQAFGGAQAK